MNVTSHRIATSGVTLHAVVEGSGPPVLLLHGFTGSGEDMAEIARALARDHRTVRVDLVGHGASDAPRETAPYRMERCVEQVAGVVRALGAGPARVIGYSMGARVALALCAWRPDLVTSAVVLGARAGIADPLKRAQRVRADERLADRIERDGVERFVDAWMALPLFASQRRLGPAFLAEARRRRLSNRAHGLAGSLRGMGAGAQPPLHGALCATRAPICLVAGEEDARFRAVADALAALLPGARTAVVPGAGHAAHVERPREFLRIARRFLAGAGAPVCPPAGPELAPGPNKRTASP